MKTEKHEKLEESSQEIAGFKADLEKLKEKTAHFSEEAKKEFDERVKELEELIKDAEAKYEELKVKTEENWNDLKDFVALTNKALRHSFKYFMSHYRKKGE